MQQPVTKSKKRGIAVSENGRAWDPTALWDHQSMSQNASEGDSSDAECPTCGRDDFASEQGMKRHHYYEHGESIAGRPLTCDECGCTFERSKKTDTEQSFCSRECYQNHRKSKVEVECNQCKETFLAYPSRIDRSEMLFCSRSCQGAWKSENNVGAKHPRYSKVEAECHSCNTSFRLTKSHFEKDDRHFCSKDCHCEWMSERMAGPKNPFFTENISTMCRYCGEEFEIVPSRVERGEGQFCSKACMGNWNSEHRRRKDAANWRGGIAGRFDYGPGWNEEKRERVRDRDDRRCQSCGCSEREHIETYGKKHPVHHIRKARSFDDPRKRNADSNLVTLCVDCHYQWEGIPLRPQLTH